MVPDAADIVVVPLVSNVAKPVWLMVATEVLEDVHDTDELMSFTVPSLKVPVAVNCCVVFVTLTEASIGEIWIVASGEVITLTVVETLIPSDVALIVAEPFAIAVANPLLLMKTMAAFEVVHAAEGKTFVVPFWYVAVAVNCCWLPTSSDGAGGEIVSEVMGEAQNSCPPIHDVPTIVANTSIANSTGFGSTCFIMPPGCEADRAANDPTRIHPLAAAVGIREDETNALLSHARRGEFRDFAHYSL